MRILPVLFLIFFLANAAPLPAMDIATVTATPSIGGVLENAISQNLIAGGVVVVGNRSGILSTTAKGRLGSGPDAPPINEKTLFDVASLTKVVAAAPAVMKLLEEGRIALSDPVVRWFPEFKGSGREDITLLNLLTHTSGLTDLDARPAESISSLLTRVAAQQFKPYSTINFKYADINFIMLGELVHRVSGKALDSFTREQIFLPAGMLETTFLPSPLAAATIAPTSTGHEPGVVQDENARRLGGVAGHAGLFSSASDLAGFARLFLGGGTLEGQRIFAANTVRQMTSPYLCNNGSVRRGLGWDIDSPFSAPKGELFSPSSFGHTGYSGSSIWIDPEKDLFVVLLTVRLNYRDTRLFNQLRRDVSAAAASSFGTFGEIRGMPPQLEAELTSMDPNLAAIGAAVPKHSRTGISEARVQQSKQARHTHAKQRLAQKERKLAKATGQARSGAKKRSLNKA